MRKIYNYIKNNILFYGVLILLTGFVSCNNEDNPESPYVRGPKEKETAILLYAVASNNLEYNLHSDKREIIACAPEIDLETTELFLYEVTNAYEPVLLKLVKTKEGSYEFENVKNYSTTVSSASAERMEEVISDFEELVSAPEMGLILWSHGTGVQYYENSPETKYSGNILTTEFNQDGSFGYDLNPDTRKVVQMNIDTLAKAIPDNMFSFIWFDACYMGSIEVIYELRNKAEYMVAYPTEVFEWGVPYHLVLPYILKPEPDLIGGAREFFDYYDLHSNTSARVATVAVIDLSKSEEVAQLCKEAYAGNSTIDKMNLQKYSRNSVSAYYDLNGYTLRKAASLDNFDEWSQRWEDAMEDFIIYKAATPYDFNWNPINLSQFCGISCYIPDVESTVSAETFYRSLEWYKATYPDEEL